jgi:hypothetical protein
MADRVYAKVLEILCRQTRQHIAIDIIFAKNLLVSFEAETAQPRPYVHHALSSSSSSAFASLRSGVLKPSVNQP